MALEVLRREGLVEGWWSWVGGADGGGLGLVAHCFRGSKILGRSYALSARFLEIRYVSILEVAIRKQ